MMLGAFQANIPEEGIYYFFGGFLAMTPMWFGALAATMHLLAKKIKLPKTRFTTVFANDIKASAKQIWSKYFSEKTEQYYLDSIVDLVKLHQNNKNRYIP